MYKNLLSSILFLVMGLLTSVPTMAQDKTPAFPGAEGFGRYVTGGRGGAVYHVTSLADDGSVGTFRWACQQSGARTIVFDVAGTIHLTSELKLQSGNVTIAGQTAPGYGICIADYPFSINANNVIIRYMRFRLGNKNVTLDGADGWDGLGGMDKENIMVDHCSVSWSIDECLSVYGVRNATVQWCIAAQSLQDAGHSKGEHGYGGNWGGSGVTYHHNLLAHHSSRVPRLGPRYTTQLDERLDMRNNVFYNWAGNGCYGGEAMNVNIVNNYYKPGPATRKRNSTIQRRIASIGIRTTKYVTENTSYAPTEHVWGKFYIDGNVNPLYSDVTNDNWTYGVYNQISSSDNDGLYTETTKDTMKLSKPIDFVHVTTHSAADAYQLVLDYAGASKMRDSYDEFIVDETRDGLATYTGADNYPGIINTPEDNRPSDAGDDWSPWPDLTSTETAPVDTDGDGMPDAWETANGLDPEDSTDGAEVDSDGYTNLENYLNSLVAEITEAQLQGGEVMGVESVGEGEASAAYELSPQTYDQTVDGNWLFTNGFSITPASGSYSDGSSCGITGIKFSRNRDYTINIPDGISIASVDIKGYCNGDNQTAYLSELGSETFTNTQYVFPSRTGGVSVSYSVTLAQAATESLHFRIAGDNQCVWVITLHELTSGIDGVTVGEGNAEDGRIYNLQGIEVKDTAKPGVYIRDGKKFVMKR